MLEQIDTVPLGEPIAIDTETSGLGRWTGDHLMGICVAAGDWAAYVPVGHRVGENWDRADALRLVRALARHDGPLVFHHGKFDWKWLGEVHGSASVWMGRSWDTMVASQLEDENRPSHKLKDLASRLLDEDGHAAERELKKLLKGASLDVLTAILHEEGAAKTKKACRELARTDPRHEQREWWQLTPEEMAPYGADDARFTLGLYRYQRDRIRAGRADIEMAMPREMRFQGCLYRMEEAGIRVNQERAWRLRARAVARKTAIEDAFRRHYGMDKLRGPKLTRLVYETWGHRHSHKTPKGNDSCAQEVLEQLAIRDPRVALILERSRLATAVERYYDPLLGCQDTEGRVHPTFNSENSHGRGGATRTGRLTCSDPNLQTIPRAGNPIDEVRQVFCAADGYELWEYDLKQAELRVAAALSRDERMMAAFQEGRDLYQEMADELCIPRQTAKTLSLSFQYGGGIAKLADIIAQSHNRQLQSQTGAPRLVAPDVRAASVLYYGVRRLYPGLTRAMSYFEQVARIEGRIPLAPAGRYRHFAGAGFLDEPRKAFNSACQGGVACLMQDLQIHGEAEAHNLGARFVLQVHDSLVTEVPPGAGPLLGERLQKVLDQVNPFPWVRQVVDAKEWA